MTMEVKPLVEINQQALRLLYQELGIVNAVQGQPELLHVVGALHSAGRLARGLDRRQQQRDQNADDRDDHEQLHEREPSRWRTTAFG